MANNNMAFVLIAAGVAVIGAGILLQPKADEDRDQPPGVTTREVPIDEDGTVGDGERPPQINRPDLVPTYTLPNAPRVWATI